MVHFSTPISTVIPTESSPNGARRPSPTSTINVFAPQGFLTPLLVNAGDFPESPRSTSSSGSLYDLRCPHCGSSDVRSLASSSSSSASSPNCCGAPPPSPMPAFQPRNVNMDHGRGQRGVPPPPPGMGAGQPSQPNAPPAGPPNVMGFQPGINNHFYAGGAAIALNLQTPGTYVVGLTADIAVDGRGAWGRAHHRHPYHQHPGDAGHVDPATHGITGHYHQ